MSRLPPADTILKRIRTECCSDRVRYGRPQRKLLICFASKDSPGRSGAASRRALLLSQAVFFSLASSRADAAAETKRRGLPIDELKTIIAHDFQTNQYYITGKLTPSIFTDDCVFVDPTTRVTGVEKYSKAVAALFDPKTSRADLISIQVAGPRTISARWRFAASLNVPGKPKLKPYTGSTTYKLDAQGLVCEHAEDWDISALDAFVSILLPSFGAPAAPPVENPVKA